MNENSLQGKICLVTGSTSGIGKVTARELANRGATVVLVSRNRAKGEATQAEIKQTTGNQQVELLVADLSLLKDVRRLATEFQQTHRHLHLLVNNAGGAYPTRTLTSEGLEATLAVNYLAPFLLTELLLDTLKVSAPARIVNVSSTTHTSASIEFDNLQGEKKYTNLGNYSQAKLALLLWTYELARRLEGTGVTVNALHPGVVASNFTDGMGGPASLVMKLFKPFLLTVDKGAQTTLYLATSPQVEGVSGKYFVKSQEKKSSSRSYDQTVGLRLWEVTEQLVARSMQQT
ncbi:MAG TPA: SDR family oxidoreductase [Ktedonobacteraceae bacterium]|nr:SDR family oxidoreductase [Ktedonobacteraceae bacterium]